MENRVAMTNVFLEFTGLDKAQEVVLETPMGFKYHLLRLVESRELQENIRPKLKFCNTIDAVGHSLGGAMATLFSMCIHNAPCPSKSENALPFCILQQPGE